MKKNFLLIFKKPCSTFTKTTYTLKDYYHIDVNSEDAMKEALTTIGPVSVCLYASVDTFYNYKSGVWDGKSTPGVQCPTSCNHAVLLIGIFSCIYFILLIN